MIRIRYLAVALVVAAMGCSGKTDGPPPGATTLGAKAESAKAADVRASLPAGVAEQLDSGNAAYRRSDFALASQHFREATRLGPKVAAAWYGVYMAEHALGHVAAADSAGVIANQLAPGVLGAHNSMPNPHQQPMNPHQQVMPPPPGSAKAPAQKPAGGSGQGGK